MSHRATRQAGHLLSTSIKHVQIQQSSASSCPYSVASTSKTTLEHLVPRHDAGYELLHHPSTLRPASHSHGHGQQSTFSAVRRREFSVTPRRRQVDVETPVSEELLQAYAESPPAYVTLNDLIQYGRPPLSEEALIASAEATRRELPHRLARRVLAHRSLPFIVGRNPYIARVYDRYESSFKTLSAVPPLKTREDNEAFSLTLDELVADHADNVSTLAKGFSECKEYLSEDEISTFFDRAIRNRIGIRLIAEQHLALTFASDPAKQQPVSAGARAGSSRQGHSEIGVVETRCGIARIVRQCGYHVETLCEGVYGRSPDLKITGDVHASFAYIPTHIEYVLTELLKNAFRATAERHALSSSSPSSQEMPPVLVNIAKAPGAPVVTLRVRDEGGGIPPELLPKVNSYAFTTVGRYEDEARDSSGQGGRATEEEDLGPYSVQNAGGGVGVDDLLGGVQGTSGHLAGLGFGLPLSKLHCEYFGGSMELVSLYGHGTDAFVVLKGEEAADA